MRYFIILFAMVVSGCDDLLPLSSPEQVVIKYLEARLSEQYRDSYQYISAEDKQHKNIEAFLEETHTGASALKGMLSDSIKFSIKDSVISNNKAVVRVDVIRPDVPSLVLALMDADKPPGIKGLTMKTYTQSINLRKENGQWRVFLGWQVEGLIIEARALRDKHDLIGAAEKYSEVLSLNVDSDIAAQALKEINSETKESNEKAAYIASIKLYDLKVEYQETRRHGRVPGVEFKLKNNGVRSLDRVEVTIYFKDESGSTIHEDNFHPVFVSPYSTSSNKPLKPNYVWKAEQDKFYVSKSVPDEWKEGAVSARITDIKFTE